MVYNPAIMAQAEETDSNVQVETVEPSCNVTMNAGEPCGRPIYGSGPVCLMHCDRSDKATKAFAREIERILKTAEAEAAGEGTADFTRFVFPEVDYRNRTFAAHCIFFEAKFTQDAGFGGAKFTQDANFRRATFTQNADFSSAVFTRNAYFSYATFTQNADFPGATFTRNADFSYATFTQNAYFPGATFTQDADFSVATFTQNAYFGYATFTQKADFREATFTRNADFSRVTFTQIAYFSYAQFAGNAEFRETVFRKDGNGVGPVFSLARFEKPEGVSFYKTCLGQALFHNCDVSRFNFSNVTWRERKQNRKRMVFEEEVRIEEDTAEALRPGEGSPDERNYSLIAELYQQLKKNYDDRKDYWTAGDFHYGEMEMKRLSSPRSNKVLRWLHRNLGMVAWYKYASEYGESYVRPLLWLLAVLALFTSLFPVARLNPGERLIHDATSQITVSTPDPLHLPNLSYWNFSEFAKAHPKRIRAFFGHSFMTTLDVAAFQRDFYYEPSYPWGRLLAVLELLFTSTLIALFLLALRRQFRR